MPSFGGKGSADLAGLHFFSLNWQKGGTELIFTKPSLCPPWDQELARSQIITLTTQLCPLLFSFLSCVQLFVTPWTVAHQAPLSMGFSRQEYWSGLPFPSPGDLPDPGIKPTSPAWQAVYLPLSHLGSLIHAISEYKFKFFKNSKYRK